MAKQALGRQSIQLINPVYILEHATVVGKKEGEGPLGSFFDKVLEDEMNGCNTWEEAESSLQRDAIRILLEKYKINRDLIRYIFSGDLLGQSIASTFGIMNYEKPVFDVYGACSTCGMILSLGSMAISGDFADYVICVTSSHFASAEKEFRFPLVYGNQRPQSSTWTVTGSGAFLLGRKENGHVQAKITRITTGRIVDYGLKESMNMGGCMAPAAAAIIYQHLIDFNRTPDDYDKIITGDLGSIGSQALIDLLAKEFDIRKQHLDCGTLIYDCEAQDTHSGGSGCGCSAVTLSAHILPKIASGEWKRVLFVPTGALLSKTSFNEGKSVPGIAHAVVLEHV